MATVFLRLQETALATAISQSVMLTGGLSAIHLVGFTLIMGSAIVSNLRLAGVLFADRPVEEIDAPTSRGLAVGLLISITTGLLLFAARAITASESSTFWLKMLLLVAAALFHFLVHRRVAARPSPALAMRATGAVGLTLWVAVAFAGCAFILFE
jgi:uncharacterized protein DUF6644